MRLQLRGRASPSVLADGDLDQFYSAVEPSLDKMARVAARIAGFQERHDVVQATLLQAWKHRDSYDPSKGTLSAWLLAITAHEASRLRRREVRQVREIDSASVSLDSDARVDVSDALNRLTPRERLAVDCFYFADLTIAETAAAMCCSEGTAKSTLASARKRLSAVLR